MKDTALWLLPALLVCILAVVYFRVWESRSTAEPEAVSRPKPTPAREPAVRYPVATGDSESSLPPLGESDDELRTALLALFGNTLPKLLRVDKMVHRIVATVDNLPRDHLAPRLLPVQTADGLPLTEKAGESVSLSRNNSDRYRRYIQLAEAVPTAALIKLYARFYPLFQEQYENLGYPGRHFNDRAVEVIDHLLATPEVPEPLRLIQPAVLYEFADPELEDLSAGQKILLRVGKTHRDVLKRKLRELRDGITGLRGTD